MLGLRTEAGVEVLVVLVVYCRSSRPFHALEIDLVVFNRAAGQSERGPRLLAATMFAMTIDVGNGEVGVSQVHENSKHVSPRRLTDCK